MQFSCLRAATLAAPQANVSRSPSPASQGDDHFLLRRRRRQHVRTQTWAAGCEKNAIDQHHAVFMREALMQPTHLSLVARFAAT